MAADPSDDGVPGVFVYFEDFHGIIYYSYGEFLGPGREYVRACAVYYPARSGSQLYCSRAGSTYVKHAAHGLPYEEPFLRRVVPGRALRHLSRWFTVDPATGEPALAVGRDAIVRVFGPVSCLDVIDRFADQFSNSQRDAVQDAVDTLAGVGISSGDVFLYGSIQCNLTRLNSPAVNDVDIVLRGIRYYSGISRLTCDSAAVDVDRFPEFIRTDPVRRVNATRRCQLSQVRTRGGRYSMDIRISRARGDDCRSHGLVGPARPVTMRAIVVGASESLCVPACFDVEDPQGRQFHVTTWHYHHLGAATRDDAVIVNGSLYANGLVRLADPERHYIRLP